MNTGSRHLGKFGTTSIPVPDTSVSSVRHPYRHREYRYRTEHTLAFSHSYCHPLARDFSQRKTTVFDAIVDGRWSVFVFHFLCVSSMPSSVRMIIFPVYSLKLKFVVQMECRIFSVSYSCNMRSSFNLSLMSVDPTWARSNHCKRRLLCWHHLCVAAVDALINGQALSTQAQRSALAHFAIWSLPVLPLLI